MTSSPESIAILHDQTPWKGKPPPDPGRLVSLTHRVTEKGRTRWVTIRGVVVSRAVSGTTMTVDLDSGTSARLDSTSFLDKWSYLDDGSADPVEPTPEVEPEAHRPPPADADDLFGMLARLRFLDAELDRAEAEVKSIKDEIASLNVETVRAMVERGMASVTIDGKTASMYPKSHVERKAGVEPEKVLEAMRAAGLGHMIKAGYNGGTLKAYLTELNRNGMPVPPDLDEVVTLVTDYEIRFVQAAARKRIAPDPFS